jgi:NAD(P)-dependent dehydrogenase (short-subunit alcohol dehydrogenase family)
MDTGMKGRVAVITGGSAGIGLAVAEAFLREGAKVAICGRNQRRLDDAAAQLGAMSDPARVLAQSCDVRDEAEVAALRDAVAAAFGGCDALICNAGEARQSDFYDTSDQDWRDEFELKFFSVLRPVRAFLPMLEASGQGAIVCSGALIARRPEPFLIATGATRAGQLNLAKSLSVELAAKNVRVNSILIGLVDSGQWSRRYDAGQAPDGMSREDWYGELARDREIPLGRLGRPDEAANVILFLASPLAS